jgi:hypothetical protein
MMMVEKLMDLLFVGAALLLSRQLIAPAIVVAVRNDLCQFGKLSIVIFDNFGFNAFFQHFRPRFICQCEQLIGKVALVVMVMVLIGALVMVVMAAALLMCMVMVMAATALVVVAM